MSFLRPRPLYLTAAVLTGVFILFTLYNAHSDDNGPSRESDLSLGLDLPVRHQNIAIVTSFGFHFNVYMAVAWTIGRIFQKRKGFEDNSLHVYAPYPFYFDFQETAEAAGVYNGTHRNYEQLLPDLLHGVDGKHFDMVVLGTCEVDMRPAAHEELFAAWQALDEAHKFKLVCIVHDVSDEFWFPSTTDWVRNGALRLLPISQHVADAFRDKATNLADSDDILIQSAGYEYMPIDVHVQMLDLPHLPERPSTGVLSNVVIQGSFSLTRRRYEQIFSDLSQSLSENPSLWGYRRTENSYEVDSTLPGTPFHLYLIGSGALNIPEELSNVVSKHVELTYPEFYALMSTMDLCVPAFSSSAYYVSQASSTFATCLESNVPILVTNRMKESYTYADDLRVTIHRPAAMGEIAAVQALRSGSVESFWASSQVPYNPQVRDHVDRMMRDGWYRSKQGFQDFKEGVFDANERVMERVLRDLNKQQGEFDERVTQRVHLAFAQ